MNVAELFVQLGIQGADKTVSSLVTVRQGLGSVASMSLEAKAGILAAVYALEQMTAKSGATGTNLENFAAFTGQSAQQLQQWQYAARQAGVSADDMAGSVKSVQSAMSNMLLGKGAPEGLGVLARTVGWDQTRARDTFYVMGQLVKAAQQLPQDIGNQVLKSFGVSEGFIAAARRGVFNPNMFKNAPTYSPKELAALDRANIAWSNLGLKIEMAFGHFNAAHGGQLVNDITKIADAVIRLAEALLKLSNAIGVFSGLSKLLTMTANSINNLTDIGSDREKADVVKMLNENIAKSKEPVNFEDTLFGKLLTLSPNSPIQHHTTIHQNITHHGDAKDTKSVKDTHNHAVRHAMLTNRSINQVT